MGIAMQGVWIQLNGKGKIVECQNGGMTVLTNHPDFPDFCLSI